MGYKGNGRPTGGRKLGPLQGLADSPGTLVEREDRSLQVASYRALDGNGESAVEARKESEDHLTGF